MLTPKPTPESSLARLLHPSLLFALGLAGLFLIGLAAWNWRPASPLPTQSLQTTGRAQDEFGQGQSRSGTFAPIANALALGMAVQTDPVTISQTLSVTVAISNLNQLAETEVVSVTLPLTPTHPLHETTNILLLGSDRRPKDPNWRTDVMMLLAIDKVNGRVGVVSIPRDVYLERIPNHQPNRINVVDYLGERDEPNGGGPALLTSILEERLGLPIHHYLRFEFTGFKAVIDALDGIEVDVACRLYDYLPEEDIWLNLQPGHYLLNGPQSLAYVRSRAQGGDLARAARQQQVVWAVRSRVLAHNLLPRIPALYVGLKDRVNTDIGLLQAVSLVRFALNLTENNIYAMTLSPPAQLTSGWRLGMSVFIADWPQIQEDLRHLFERDPLAAVAEGDAVHCP